MPKNNSISDLFSKIVIIVFLLYYVLQTYGYEKYNITFVLLTILALCSVAKNGLQSSIPKYLNIYFCYWSCAYMLLASSFVTAIPSGIIRTYLVYNMIYTEFKYDIFIKYYKKFATIFILFFFFQEAMFLLTGQRIPGVIQSLPLALDVDAGQFFDKLAHINRSASVFSEPSHFAQFLAPLLAILLFENPKRKNFLFAGVILITMLRLQSGTAILLSMAIMGAFFFYKIMRNFNLKTFIYLSSTCIIMVLIVLLFLRSESGQELGERQEELTQEQSMDKSASSGFVRVYRGYFIYNEMTDLEKVFGGDSYERMQRAIDKSPFSWTFRENEFYFNCFQTLLIKTGIVGTILFFIFYVWQFRRVRTTGKVLLFALLCLSFIEAIHFRETMLFYLITAGAFHKSNVFLNRIKSNINKQNQTQIPQYAKSIISI